MRYLLSYKKSTWEKLLLVARFLDLLEADYKQAFPELEEPMPGGYEASLRRLLEEKYGGK